MEGNGRNYLGLGSLKDWQLVATIRAADFRVLYGQEPLHAGVIIIVPNATPVLQRELFTAALKHIGARDLTNAVIEVTYARSLTECLNTCYQNPVNDTEK